MEGDSSDESSSGSPGEAGFMSVVLLAMFVCLFIGWKTPETVVCLSVLITAAVCGAETEENKTEGATHVPVLVGMCKKAASPPAGKGSNAARVRRAISPS